MNSNIFEKFSPNLKKILVLSERISKEHNTILNTEHQLQSLLLVKGTLAYDILSLFEISSEKTRLATNLVSDKFSKKPLSGISNDAKSAIQLAIQFASKYKHHQVDTEHLLFALASTNRFNSFSIIEKLGVDPKRIIGQIESIFSEINKSYKSEQISSNFLKDGEISLPPIEGMGPMPGVTHTMAKTKKASNLELFTLSITKLARQKKLDPVIGRQNQITRIIQILSRRKKNNPVLLGEPGVGKTAIVEGLAQKIVCGEVPAIISGCEILSLDLGALLAGTMYRGQFESRIKSIITEIKKKKNIILFIDEIHTVVGAGSAEGSVDAANILKPSLSRGEIKIIGATTFDEYKKNIEKDPAFERRLQSIMIPESSKDETLKILEGIRQKYQIHHNVIYTNEALVSAVKLSNRYIQDRFLPDKAIDLIDEAAAAKNVISKDSKIITDLKSNLLLISEKKDKAVAGEDYQNATRLRQQEINIKNKIKNIKSKISSKDKDTVSENDIAGVVSRWANIPLTNITLSERKTFLNLEKRLSKYIIGQDEAISEIAQALRRSRIGVSDPNRPIGSFIFLGPTGVGKTELVKVLAEKVYGSKNNLVKIDMSEFMERHNVSRLLGAPAGYIGYEDGGQLTEIIRRNQYSVVLFDEIEKAHFEVFNILLQILEDGEITDAKGRRVNFRNTLIVMTSNLGTELMTRQASIGFDAIGNAKLEFDQKFNKLKENIMDTVESHFRPEFLNRVDRSIVFKPLNQIDIQKIATREINKLVNRISENKILVSVDKKAKNWIAKKGFKPEYGARPMKRVISKYIEDPLSQLIINDEIKSGQKINISLVNNKLLIKKIKKDK